MNFKTILTALICFALGIGVMLLLNRCNERAAVKAESKLKITDNAPVTYYFDRCGSEHAQKPVSIGNYDALLNIYEAKIDSQATAIGIKDKQIKALIQAALETEGTLSASTATDYDQVPQPCPEEISWSDRWTAVHAFRKDSGWLLQYQVKDTATITSYYKKMGWFKRALYVDIKMQNPNTHVAGIQALQVANKPKRWGLGMQVGYTYAAGQWRPVISAGINYNFIRW